MNQGESENEMQKMSTPCPESWSSGTQDSPSKAAGTAAAP